VAVGEEGHFTTGSSPVVEASTGAPSAITPTTAVLSGAVNPAGESATYSFELGVYAGASTVYGVVLSGPVPAETSAVTESEQLTGLQPGKATISVRCVPWYGEISATMENRAGGTVLATTKEARLECNDGEGKYIGSQTIALTKGGNLTVK